MNHKRFAMLQISLSIFIMLNYSLYQIITKVNENLRGHYVIGSHLRIKTFGMTGCLIEKFHWISYFIRDVENGVVVLGCAFIRFAYRQLKHLLEKRYLLI